MEVLLDHLPADSFYIEAVANDEEQAALQMGQPEPPRRPPALSQFSPVVARLTDVLDGVRRLESTLIAVHTGKRPPAEPPTPRPVTAVDRMKKARSLQRHSSLVSEVQEAQARWAAAREGAPHGGD